jgi:cytochrome c
MRIAVGAAHVTRAVERCPGGGRTLATGVLIALACLALPGCGRGSVEHDAAVLAQGSPQRGRRLIQAYGCGSCHAIPGVVGADATVGPPLAGIAGRSYIAGVLTNEPDHMVRWLLDPPAVDSLTAMPNLGLSMRDAHDVAAYLYTLH